MMSANLDRTPPRASTSLRILLADDDEILGAAVGGLLEHLGHSVDVVTSGREAIEFAMRENFQVVFLDIQMPGMGGLEAAHWLRHDRAIERPLRIIGFSCERPDREAYQASGMDAFLLKPVRLADLIQVLNPTDAL